MTWTERQDFAGKTEWIWPSESGSPLAIVWRHGGGWAAVAAGVSPYMTDSDVEALKERTLAAMVEARLERTI